MRNLTALALVLLLVPTLSSANSVCDAIERDNDNDMNLEMHWEQDFQYEEGKLIITAQDGTEYNATRDGGLLIDGVQQNVSEHARADIAHYVERYAELEDRAKQIASRATGLAISALTHALVALATQGEDAVDAAVEEKTKNIETAIEADAHNLCKIVIDLRDTERKIRAAVPTFGPFIEFRLTEEIAAGDNADD